ncbi:unnamed protein product [Spirodela intermedia]|uniref:SURP motif domain-containing protein n=1 Tax=Spirodela intermedia TaxID=51605 RepID=A0A7I8IFB7_SPIIN|nr:unnamed protein product [Spirodela intermedia]CAA6655793.1 unnamed protein product [Spirodela intermedia]
MTERAAAAEVLEEEKQGGAGVAERRTRRGYRHERPPLPHEHSPSQVLPPVSNREHIDKVARFVAEEEDFQAHENQERWGFLSADDPHHAYYGRRVAERRRTILGNSRWPPSEPLAVRPPPQRP